MLNGFDYAILGVIALSALFGVVRGFVREVFSLVSWILAFWIAFNYAPMISVYFERYLSTPALRVTAAFAALFVGALIVLTVISVLIYKLISKAKVSGMDRMLGGLFGICRAVVIVAGFMLVAGVTALPQEPWWRESMLSKHFAPLVLLLRDLLPAAIAEHLVIK